MIFNNKTKEKVALKIIFKLFRVNFSLLGTIL